MTNNSSMKLTDWLSKSGTSQAELARQLAITQGRVSQLCGGAKPSLELALRIRAITKGAVSPQDFNVNAAGNNIMPDKKTSLLDSVEEAVAAIAAGEMVVVVDDDDRENEGDLIASAAKISSEQMAMMIRHTSGIVCVPLTAAEAHRLRLDPMVAINDAPTSTAFTISVDYKVGLTTGISATERVGTVRALANSNVQADDFVRPGHVFPLVARSGGVLMRSGHTEAAVDLCKLAGLPPVGVISELMNDDGSVMRGPQVMAFARAHKYKMISVADLISYRQARERLVEREGMFEVETPVGPARAFAYSTPFDQVQHLALVFGDISGGENIPVRLHREDLLADVFGARSALNKVYDTFKREGSGVLVYLREGTTGVPGSQLHATSEEVTETAKARKEAWRDVGLGAQILRDLGVSSIRLIASRNRHYVGLSGFGIEISETLRNDV